MHRIETEHARVVCENHQVEFFPIVICFSGEENMPHHNPCCRWVHLYMDTPRDTTQYPLCVSASSVTVISGMLVYYSHVVFLQAQIQCEVLSQAMEEGQCQGI